jgi:hypothetical protein
MSKLGDRSFTNPTRQQGASIATDGGRRRFPRSRVGLA